jgi:hypothetical protein
MLQEPDGLAYMRVADAEVDIGKDDGAIVGFQGYTFVECL